MKYTDYIKNLSENKKWSWWGQRAHDALGLNEMLEFDFLVSCDWGSDIEEIWGEKVVSIEKQNNSREDYSNNDINRFFYSDNILNLGDIIKKGSNCVMYRSNEKIEELSNTNNNIKIFSAPISLKDKFDNKILFRDIVKSSDLPLINGEVLSLTNKNYKDLSQVYGNTFIIKYPVASSGKRTHYIDNKKDFNALKKIYKYNKVIIEQYLPGFSLCLNAVISDNKNYIAQSSVQVIGNPLLTNDYFGYCGNDFSSYNSLPQPIKTEVSDQANKIMDYLRENGFRGLMGLDFLVYEDEVYPIEINPRFQNSTSMLTLLEISSGSVPLVFFHILQFLDKSYQDIDYDNTVHLNGSQITLHNLDKSPLNIRNPIKHGIYTFQDDKLTYIRKGYSVTDCNNADEFAVCCGVPAAGTIIQPMAPIFKLHFSRSILQDNLMKIDNTIELKIKKIYNKFIGENHC